MGIREKLLDFKRRLSDRKMYSIVIVIIAAVSIFGIYQYKHAANLRQELDNQYNRAFYDMVGYVQNVETLLAKSLITATPVRTATTLQEAWRQSNLAQTNLGQLPVSQPVLANTSKFLIQVGDLSNTLNNQNIRGKPLSSAQYKTVEQLYNYSVSLGKSLGNLQNQLADGRLRWGELADKGTSLFKKTSANISMKQIQDIDKTFQNYPTLIYDGPFSDHMTSAELKGLTGNEMSQEQAKKSVIEFIGQDRIKDILDAGKNDTGTMKTYSYSVSLKNTPEDRKINIGVTQKGGHVYWMLYNRPVTAKKLEMDQAKKKGLEFLESKGYKNMGDTYYLTEDNTATINYAYKQQNVVVYPDLIKLKIALDTGEITGFEAKAYISAHTGRNIPKPAISLEEAKKKINSRMKILSSGLAIIPTNHKTEIFCYEFKGKLNDKDFIVYINAETGEEEDILMIVNTPNGILTM
ncbi:MAG: germination protein YpeB [Ruminiclostridium sp.]|nr:germination protein YpeB [Ruminiclostridium sp.]